MSTWGNATTPGSGYFYDYTGNSQYASEFASWPGGVINTINIYVAGYGGSVTVHYCIWDHSNNLLWSSAGHTIAGGSNSIGGQAWQSNGTSNLYIPPKSYLKLGIMTPGSVIWTWESSGSVQYDHGPTSPTTFTVQGTEGSGSFGAYLDYTYVTTPVVTAINPLVGTVGTAVTITGTGFTGTTSVTVNGAAASFTVVSDTQITTTVPSGATPGSGTIVVTNPAGSDYGGFTVGQVYYGDTSNVAHPIVQAYYGDPSGNGAVHPLLGVWVPNGTGVKRIW